MSNRPEEISNILKEQIRNYKSRIEMNETGTVITVGDGIARVYGLRSCMANELLRFEDGSVGMAQNLEEDTVSVAVLSDKDEIREGTTVYRTGKALSVPVMVISGCTFAHLGMRVSGTSAPAVVHAR